MPSSVTSTSSSDDGLLVGGGIGLDINKLNLTEKYANMAQQAIQDPSSLTPQQLEDISRTICAKAFEKSIYSYPISSILITICDKNTNQLFTQSLINCCREWFNDRNRLLRPAEGTSSPIPRKHRWPAFIAFITDFYLNLKCKLRGVSLTEEDEREFDETEDTEVPSDHVHYEFADILFDCCSDIVNILDTTSTPTTEIECLLGVLRCVGKHMERDDPKRMDKLIDELKVTFIGPVSTRLPENCVKSILELIEWAASGWTFSKSQVAYYYPSLS